MFSFLGRPRGASALAAASTIALVASISSAYAQEQVRTFNIPAQPLASALIEFSRQSDIVVVADPAVVNGRQAPALQGSLTVSQGLDRLLAGSGLTHSLSPSGAILVQQTSPTQLGAADGVSSYSDNEEEIVVTGTSIRGAYPRSSPLTSYGEEEIARSGAVTVEQFIRQLPQNSASLSSVAPDAAPGGRGGGNSLGVSGVDLRGLGPGSTLVLLNGRRIAGAADGQTPDLSLLPLAAIRRIDVLSDGASAIYGTDAVAGVVNFILDDEFDGAETTIQTGTDDDGSTTEVRADHALGSAWQSGNALLVGSVYTRSELDAAERDYSAPAAPFTLIPSENRYNVLASLNQQLATDWLLGADLLVSSREARLTQRFAPDTVFGSDVEQQQTHLNVGLVHDISDNHSVEAAFSYSRLSETVVSALLDPPTPPDTLEREAALLDATIKLQGTLFRWGAGDVLFSLGGGHTEETRDSSVVGAFSVSTDRMVDYFFAEVALPLVSPEQNVPWAHRLDLSLAGRQVRYSDFGDEFIPKVGIAWEPISALRIRGTYGESFRAPFLSQLDPTRASWGLFDVAGLGTPDIWTPDNSAILLFADGTGNPNLGPERSESYTIGFDYNPSESGLRINATYYDIQYTGRISSGDPTGGFAAIVDPGSFPFLFTVGPNESQILDVTSGQLVVNTTGLDPTDIAGLVGGVTVILDNRLRNIARSDQQGVDAAFSYTHDAWAGQITYGANVTYILDYQQETVPGAAPVELVGTFGNPPDYRLSGYLAWAGTRITAQLTANYIDGYINPSTPDDSDVDDWTTFDFAGTYEFPTTGLTLSLAVHNIFDADPPDVSAATISNAGLNVPIGFDPTNATPLGRYFTIRLRKTW